MGHTPKQLGKYRLVAEIARGGIGIIYLAETDADAGLKRLVVVKQLKPDLVDDERLCNMFRDEARIASRLDHRNIVRAFDIEEDAGALFFSMEYLEGRTLTTVHRLRAAEGGHLLDAPAVLRIASSVLAALHYAHELTDDDGAPLDIVHRDVSAQNVFLTYDGQVKLLDFGVAKSFGQAQESDPNMLKGRVDCMSPEYLGDEPIDRRADVFAVGVLLREALTGARVWQGHGEIAILRELAQGRIPSFPDDAALAPELRAIVEKAMAPSPHDRFPTAHAMRATIDQHLAKLDPSGSLAPIGEAIAHELADQRARVRALLADDEPAEEDRERPLPALPMSVWDLRAASPSSDKLEIDGPKTIRPKALPPAALDIPAERTKKSDAPPARRGWLLFAAIVVVALVLWLRFCR